MGIFTVNELAQNGKMIYAEYGFPEKIILDAGTNFTSDIQTVLQADEHPAVHNLILSPLEQWPSEGMHKTSKT